jgi:antitoxin ChpS
MPSVTLRNLGGSVVLAVPKKILNLVHLDAGSRVEISVQNGRLVIEPPKKPRYTLAELLSRCNPRISRPGEKIKSGFGVPLPGESFFETRHTRSRRYFPYRP